MARDDGRIPWWGLARWPILASLVGSAVFITRAGYVSEDGRSFTLFDDAMVSMRFARNLADGHGLVYNSGEAPVEGFTNFLWTLWMAALHLVPVPTRFVPLLVSLSGAVLLAAGIALTGSLGRRVAPGTPAVAAIAMWAVAAYYPLVFWTLRGLEPGLLAVLTAAAVLLAWRIRDRPGGVPATGDAVLLAAVLGAGVLTRTDFVVPAAVVLVWLAWPGASRDCRRAAALVAAVALAVLLALTGFRLAYYGEVLPNTYHLKVAGIPLTTRLDRGGRAFAGTVVSELALAVALAGLAFVSRRSAKLWLLAALVGATAAYSVSVGGDAWEYLEYGNRYVAPVVPLLLVLAAIGVVEVVALPRARRALALGALAGLAVGAAFVNARIGPEPRYNVRVDSLLDELDRAHWIAGLAAAALLLVAIVAARVGRNPALAIVAVVGALVLAVALPAWLEWGGDGGHLVRRNSYEARLGLALGSVASGDPTVAVVAAGTIPYWSELPAVDLLGKSDPVIARRPSRDGFHPGHSKRDYRYSICELRPDVVLQLFEPSARERRLVERCGYEKISGFFYARRDQTGFDRQALSRVIFTTR